MDGFGAKKVNLKGVLSFLEMSCWRSFSKGPLISQMFLDSGQASIRMYQVVSEVDSKFPAIGHVLRVFLQRFTWRGFYSVQSSKGCMPRPHDFTFVGLRFCHTAVALAA